jgi:hypothetical protein
MLMRSTDSSIELPVGDGNDLQWAHEGIHTHREVD